MQYSCTENAPSIKLTEKHVGRIFGGEKNKTDNVRKT